jgi:hypothetical protein
MSNQSNTWIKYNPDLHTLSIGDSVLYVPLHASGDTNHPHCENGIVTSFSSNTSIVFVVYKMTPNATSINDIYIREFAVV